MKSEGYFMFEGLKHFFNKDAQRAKEQLDNADKELIRVVEDIVDTLIKLNVVQEKDLPPDAIKKLNARKALRQELINKL
jgi:hypothetical protein